VPTAKHRRHDVVVVGGRVAGSATAMLLARLGHDVVVVDQGSFASDTISTHSIARSGVVQLQRWDLLQEVLDSGAPAIRNVTFNSDGESVSRQVKDKAGVDLVMAPRRYVLDGLLGAASERAGADVRYGVSVSAVQRDSRGRAVGVVGRDGTGAPIQLDARFVVGADGQRSRVARSVGAAVSWRGPSDGATQYAYYAGIPWTGIELFVAPRTFAGVFPTHHGEACIWVCTPSTDAAEVRRRADSRIDAFDEMLARSAPELFDRLRQARRTSQVQGVLRQPNQVRQAYGPGWALVGDAGYSHDAVTACGISDAFRDAELLAVALDQALSGDIEETTALRRYEQQRNRALREIFEITCSLAAYPPVPTFLKLQKQLAVALDKEAAAVAARPIPGKRLAATG
jgi:2-polyprenyl-6-methoxyphenol hydroxylase-like FAD-dependent oxidoreductase